MTIQINKEIIYSYEEYLREHVESLLPSLTAIKFLYQAIGLGLYLHVSCTFYLSLIKIYTQWHAQACVHPLLTICEAITGLT